MMFWIIYFSVVVYWQATQVINTNSFLNFILCIFVFFPILKNWPYAKIIKIARSVIGVIAGLLLLWHESYLPPFKIIWNFLTNPDLRPSNKFIIDFITSRLEIRLLVIFLVTICIAAVITYTKLKRYSFIFFIICILTLAATQRVSVNKDFADRFFTQEATKSFQITESPQNKFDIVILQICSLSWDDLRYANVNEKQFFNQFDYVFTNFNSATSYSDPAALRLLQSNCGQKTEGEVFAPLSDQCYLLDNLRALNYSTYSAWNHDGNYSNFQSILQRFGKVDLPVSNEKLKPLMLGFDNSPIYSDKEVLDSWLNLRNNNQNKSAFFYNSVTMHTGNGYIGSRLLSEKDEYVAASQHVFRDLDDFLKKIKASNRYTIVILLGEHGAALAGSSLQPATVRDIPLPSITQVPAAIKIFGPGFNESENIKSILIDKAVSYNALVKVLSNLLESNFTDRAQLEKSQIINNLPETSLVSESESSVVFQDGSGVFYKLKKDNKWNQLPNSFMVGPSDYLVK